MLTLTEECRKFGIKKVTNFPSLDLAMAAVLNTNKKHNKVTGFYGRLKYVLTLKDGTATVSKTTRG